MPFSRCNGFWRTKPEWNPTCGLSSTNCAFDDLPILDALEDARCTDAELLGHLRGPGPHVRGVLGIGFDSVEGVSRDGGA
jgi:hypothetical protein